MLYAISLSKTVSLYVFVVEPGGLPPTRVRFLTGEFCHQNDVILMKSAKTLLLTL
jgi:hypothetical protein